MTISDLEELYPDAPVNIEVDLDEEEASDLTNALHLLNETANMLGTIRTLDKKLNFLHADTWRAFLKLQEELGAFLGQFDWT